MRKHNKLFKKSAGILLSASLAASVFAAPVSAAANYSEAADAALKEAAGSLAEAWKTSLDNYEAPGEAETETQSLSLTYEVNVEELMLMLIPEDYQAIKDLFPLKIVQKQVMGTSPMFIQMNAESASGVKLTLNYLLDTENQIYYMQVPELSPNSVMIKGEGTEISTEALQDYLKDPIASLPTPEEVESLYYNYPAILAKHVADAGTESTTITASDVSQEVTVYHGTMNQTETADAMKELIEYAEADEDLKNVLTKLSSLSEEDIYADLMDSIAELKADLENDSEETSEEVITTNLYENSDGKIVGFDA
ncbi:MAG: hypothetical protein Q4B26_11200, partial [Eubacteriales bacterium]|nr:hypothetical protein [Eubacteriales bacterium]